ncbi:MAG: BlaI/MecI/CopY family transcriptional regulator [Verrucomicrobiota bacterium]
MWKIIHMSRLEQGQMSRRERQIMDIVYRLGQASAQDVLDNLPDPPSYSAVRALMVTLEGKGMVKHSKESRRYIYKPAITEQRARKSAVSNLLSTFFDGRPEKLVAALLASKDLEMDAAELEKIRKVLDK